MRADWRIAFCKFRRENDQHHRKFNKPIRYVMNTHPHADHTGGLPALVAEGATIITQKNNEEFFEKALNTPRTLLTDTLARNPKKANPPTDNGGKDCRRCRRR